MKSLPELSTPRLTLSALTAADIPLIVRYANNEMVTRYTANIPFPYSEKDAIFWLNQANQGLKNNNHFVFAMRDKETKAFMGGIGLRLSSGLKRAELGYWIAEPFWGQGLTTEAVSAIIRFGFEHLELHKIAAHYIAINGASGKVMAKNGMQQEGLLRREVVRHGEAHDVVFYGLLAEEYETSPH